MSFAYDTKEELCRDHGSRKCCTLAEAYGVLLFCNSFSPNEVRITTECAPFALQLPRLFWKAFGVHFDEQPEEVGPSLKATFLIEDPASMAVILDTYGYRPENSVALHINYAMLEEECCRASFLRGAFLAGGSVTDPAKRYHLELVTSHYHVNRELQALLLEMGFQPKETTRKSNYLTYFKQSGAIEDFLTSIGAPLSAMEVMNAKVEKHLRNGVNRRFNCDVANLDKAVEAAQEQIEAIRRIEAGVGLDTLPDKLRETAALRVEHPELSLSQLAELCDPPITKSALNHRLRKLVELSKTGCAEEESR